MGEHLEVGAHRGQRCPQFVGGDGGEVAGRLQRSPGPGLFIADPGQHPLDRLTDLDGIADPAHLNFLGLDCALIARACWANSRNGSIMMIEKNQPIRLSR